MALWATTKNRIIESIETLLRRATGQETPTYLEKKIISDGINSAIIDLCVDAGVSHWRFIQADSTATTTAGTAYVDLTANIFNIVSGTVRIEAEDITLGEASLEYIYSSDPDRDDTDKPQLYALDSSDDPETLRMLFKPIPDGAYAISFVGESIPDEDSISSFPSWAHGMLSDKAKENALRDLGLMDLSREFERSFKKRRADNKASQGYDGSRHVNRVSSVGHVRGLQSRVPG